MVIYGIIKQNILLHPYGKRTKSIGRRNIFLGLRSFKIERIGKLCHVPTLMSIWSGT